MEVVGWIVLGLIAIIAIWLVSAYNKLVGLKNRVQNAWSQIDVQLQRRYDLIPNLVEAVKGYMEHEKGTLKMVVDARNQAQQARQSLKESGGPTEGSLKELLQAETSLEGGLSKLFALSESYPDLKANQNMAQLQEELASTENKVAFSRQAYNDAVMNYNTAQEVFPTVLVASTFGHKHTELFQVKEEQAREAVKVKF